MVLDERTKTKRRLALEKLPTELYSAFDNTIERIRQQSQSYSTLATDILMWAHLAFRPLYINELLNALAIKSGDKDLDIDNLPSQQSWLECCLGLVVIDEENFTVRLVHFSLQEYLHSQRRDLFEKGHERIAKTCLTYLCFDSITAGPTIYTKEMSRRFPFLAYAARQWTHHMCEEENLSNEIVNLSGAYLLQPQSKLRCSLAFILEILPGYVRGGPTNWRMEYLRRVSGLHIAVYFGRLEIVTFLVETGRVDIESKDCENKMSLCWAAYHGNLEIVKFLVEVGQADIDSKDSYGSTPLRDAIYPGHLEIVRFLVETGRVDLDSKNWSNRTPLCLAVCHGHLEIVRLLIETGRVDLNAGDELNKTPLSWAALKGYIGIAELLLNAGASTIPSSIYTTDCVDSLVSS
ncbi:Inversin [Arthrobotrys entomopaga]|nr:Inversin [Arthrobotrys entomopaga]